MQLLPLPLVTTRYIFSDLEIQLTKLVQNFETSFLKNINMKMAEVDSSFSATDVLKIIARQQSAMSSTIGLQATVAESAVEVLSEQQRQSQNENVFTDI
jgi:hypothetical protein